MQQKDLVRLDRILGLLRSEHAGERASAAKAATDLIKKHDLSWWEILEGRALGPRAAAKVRKSDLGIDYLKADVEGFEIDLLEGARGLIARDAPRIAITVYHRANDWRAIRDLRRSRSDGGYQRLRTERTG